MRNLRKPAGRQRMLLARIGLISGALVLAVALPWFVPEPERPRADSALAQATHAPPRTLNGAIVQDTLQSRATVLWVQRFTGHRPVRVVVDAGARGHLVCRVLDSEYVAMVERRPSGGLCELAWTPARTGPYHIEIHNPEERSVSYILRFQ